MDTATMTQPSTNISQSTSVAVRNPLRQGQQVTLPAGTAYRTTNPRKGGVQHLKRAVTVRVHTANVGYVDLWNDARCGRGFVHLPVISYIGGANYYVDVKMTPELCAQIGTTAPALPTLSRYDQSLLDAEPGFGPGYDNRDS